MNISATQESLFKESASKLALTIQTKSQLQREYEEDFHFMIDKDEFSVLYKADMLSYDASIKWHTYRGLMIWVR